MDTSPESPAEYLHLLKIPLRTQRRSATPEPEYFHLNLTKYKLTLAVLKQWVDVHITPEEPGVAITVSEVTEGDLDMTKKALYKTLEKLASQTRKNKRKISEMKANEFPEQGSSVDTALLLRYDEQARTIQSQINLSYLWVGPGKCVKKRDDMYLRMMKLVKKGSGVAIKFFHDTVRSDRMTAHGFIQIMSQVKSLQLESLPFQFLETLVVQLCKDQESGWASLVKNLVTKHDELWKPKRHFKRNVDRNILDQNDPRYTMIFYSSGTGRRELYCLLQLPAGFVGHVLPSYDQPNYESAVETVEVLKELTGLKTSEMSAVLKCRLFIKYQFTGHYGFIGCSEDVVNIRQEFLRMSSCPFGADQKENYLTLLKHGKEDEVYLKQLVTKFLWDISTKTQRMEWKTNQDTYPDHPYPTET